MPTLILFLPPRDRLHAQGRSSAEALPRSAGDYDYLLCGNGRQVLAQGRATVADLPAAEQLVLMLAPADLSWHKLRLPKLSPARLRQALAGLLEEELLDDPDGLHFALAPSAQGGEEAWVATCEHGWLSGHLARLDAAQRFVDRVAPLCWPTTTAQGYFERRADEDHVELQWSHPDGSSTLNLQGFGRQVLAAEATAGASWRAAADAVEAGERWLGAPVAVQSRAERALQALDGPWNLRQFDLAPRMRGLHALRQWQRELMHKRWAPTRWALAGLLGVQLLGMNVWAWQQNRELERLRTSVEGVLRSAHPQVRAVLDAPLQMQRETELLRSQAGRTGDQDLEPLLAAAAAAWPADRPPLDALSFETGRLSLSSQGWSEAQLANFRRQLQSEGWLLEPAEGRMTLRRAKPGEQATR
ncbi:type II secretion system protein GspL [Pelomonas sp. SE-A7]|uniref:type II secretion system protein GspL n=1 Tax=Pelomonas sp. SE-A7 TaxID=3054953 RepID=UPI00259CBD3E|nr:type II secretion system protein GspL [Pelomonas sp. SE-A7]MDM4766427.1 type II secretion system protein GspL [Pelomonas sp. SE-A7]